MVPVKILFMLNQPKTMKTLLLVLLTLFIFKAEAQLNLNFNKRYVECEDRWVAFEMNEDSSYYYGFIYIDEVAGLTLHSEGAFKQLIDGTLQVEKLQDANLKVRLEPNNVKVAFIPENLFEDLQIEATPDWLHFYKTEINTAVRNYKWGFWYNSWNECERALPFLLKAEELDPDFEGLATEIAFSYNCLEEFEKAIAILKIAIHESPTDAYTNKEYIYSLSKAQEIDQAKEQFYASIKIVDEAIYNAENCFNILQYYFLQKDKKNFKTWYKELKKWPTSNKQIAKYANMMKEHLK